MSLPAADSSHANSIRQLVDIASNLSLVQWGWITAAWLGSHILAYFVYARWIVRRSWQLHRHLKRPIVVLEPVDPRGAPISDGNLSTELGLLRANGFLNIPDKAMDYRTFAPLQKHSVVVLGYKPGMAGLGDVLARLKVNHVPLIVYTYGNNAVAGPDKAQLDTYPYTLYANFPLTLLNSIFATVASYPYDRQPA